VRGVFLRVREITDGKHPSIYVDELATKARAMIRDFNLRILPVTNGDKKVLGKVSRRDIMAISSSKSAIMVKGVMTPARHVAGLDDDVNSTVKTMLKVDVWCAPVVTSPQDGTYRGVLGLESFIEKQIETSPEKFVKDVSEIMTKNVVTCSPDDEVEHIWRLMQEKRFAGLPVVKNGKLVGIVTHKDLLASGTFMPTFESKKVRASPRISSVMKTEVVAVEPSVKAIRVAKVMVSRDIGRVPVKDKDGRLVGIVDREDIIRLTMK
jgi:CBS domain-containing protein